MKRATWILLLTLLGCGGAGDEPVLVRSNFAESTDRWEAAVSDYHHATAPVDLVMGIRPVPPELGRHRAFFFSAGNRSDDTFFFLRRRIAVPPNRPFRVAYAITFASHEPSGCVGAGGAPGEAMVMKLGVSANKPAVVPRPDGYFAFSLDKGQQNAAGKEAAIIGNAANGRPCAAPKQYVSAIRRGTYPHVVRSDSDGELWAYVGIDSGYEGVNSIYYERIDLTLTPVP